MSNRTFYEETSYIELLDSTFQFSVTEDSVYPKILNYDDPINENHLWSNQSKIIRNKWNNVTLAVNFVWWDEPNRNKKYSYWVGKTGYIGIRNEYSKGKYKYGWLKIKVGNYDSLTIYGYGYMK